MYGRRIGGSAIKLGHEGVLYHESFIMYDHGTKSLWIHATGVCVKGKLRGRVLPFVPSVITSWANWKKRHPTTKVLQGEKGDGPDCTYTIDKRPDEFVVSVGQGDGTLLFRLADLVRHRVIQETFDDLPIVVYFDADGKFAAAWERGKRKFWFDPSSKIVRDEQGAAWDLVNGRPVDKPSAKPLVRIPATAWLAGQWKKFHPNSRTHEPSK